MKNKFWAGFAGGLTGGGVLFAVVFALYVLAADGTGNGADAGQQGTTQSSSSGSILSDDDFWQKVTKLEALIDSYYIDEVTADELEEGIYDGLLAALGDPYSCYYTQEEYEALMESSSGIYYGIGATVQQDIRTGVITIVKPFVDCPAYNAGLLPGDILYSVNGNEVTGRDLTEVVSEMKGERGTFVTLEVIRDGYADPLSFDVERDEIEVPTIEYQMLEDQIGYIYIMEFDEVTDQQFRDALDDLEEQGMQGLVIDIRDNPGGLLETVVSMLDRMLPEGLIVYTEDKYGQRTEKLSTAEESFDLPLAVLINGNSASASEIFAGAIQDYGIGTIVGTTSFGKGIVQSVIPLYDQSAVKLTVSKYYTPNGVCIHGTGIAPDVEVELNEEVKNLVVIPTEDDNQLQKAVETVKEQINNQ
ncbi:MAG TPA: S41 family peptidase [Candidatus Caccomorpha excrementavium]|nr:S41 family peptidase [Candidatus Caccomorpha excrementavium]